VRGAMMPAGSAGRWGRGARNGMTDCLPRSARPGRLDNAARRIARGTPVASGQPRTLGSNAAVRRSVRPCIYHPSLRAQAKPPHPRPRLQCCMPSLSRRCWL
jgi:hypothetical protein